MSLNPTNSLLITALKWQRASRRRWEKDWNRKYIINKWLFRFCFLNALELGILCDCIHYPWPRKFIPKKIESEINDRFVRKGDIASNSSVCPSWIWFSFHEVGRITGRCASSLAKGSHSASLLRGDPLLWHQDNWKTTWRFDLGASVTFLRFCGVTVTQVLQISQQVQPCSLVACKPCDHHHWNHSLMSVSW